MAMDPDTPMPASRPRPIWLRGLLVLLNLAFAAGALWLGIGIPSYFRSVSPLVLEAASQGTDRLLESARAEIESGRPGLAEPLLAAHRDISGEGLPDELRTALDTLYAEHPLYRWSGGPAPFYEQFLQQAAFREESVPAVIPTLLPGEHRRALLGFLRQSPSRHVQAILGTRELGGWQRFYPVYSTSGHPLDATILATALLEQASALPAGIRNPLLESIPGAMDGDPADMETLESLYIAVLTLGRYANWVQLKNLVQSAEAREPFLFAARAAQQDPDRIAILQAALYQGGDPEKLVAYLSRYGDRGWAGLSMALEMGAGATGTLLDFDKPVYQPPGIWYALPEPVRDSQQAFKQFAETWPGLAIGARALAFALCGFFLVGILRILVLGGRSRDPGRRLLINLDSLVGGSLVMLLVWVLIEPGLLDFRPNEEGTLQIRLAEIIPEAPSSLTETAANMIDQVTILILLLFFILQLLVFIFGLLKISEVRRQPLRPEVKLHLLDNEENLFDLGLYVGLGGTVSSLILVVLNIVDASLMAAYASTLFGIIFVAILKVGFLRPFRRKLILQRSA
jgi:hypothetical protein